VLHDLCKKRLASVHALPQVVQTCEHRKCVNRAESTTWLKTIELGKTLDFHHSFFAEIQIVDIPKSQQTRIDIGFAADGL